MLSLFGAFRAVARRDFSRLPAAAAARGMSSMPDHEGPLNEEGVDEINDLAELYNVMDAIAEESRDTTTQLASACLFPLPRVCRTALTRTSKAPLSIKAVTPSSRVSMRARCAHSRSTIPRPPAHAPLHLQFVQPKRFSREGYYKRAARLRRPLLGPDAKTSMRLDLFHQMQFNPLRECQNSSLLQRFVTPMGKIKKRSETNLTWKNQRRVGKAVRRAKMMGIIPVLSSRVLIRTDTDKIH